MSDRNRQGSKNNTAGVAPRRSARGLVRRAGFALNVAGLALALLALVVGCESTTERSDNRCGPDFEGAVCGENRCCSTSGWCGGQNESHCGSANGFDGAYDGPVVDTSTARSFRESAEIICSKMSRAASALQCTQPQGEQTCLNQYLGQAGQPGVSACLAEFSALADCFNGTSNSEWECSSFGGEPPRLSDGPSHACSTGPFADFADCVDRNE